MRTLERTWRGGAGALAAALLWGAVEASLAAAAADPASWPRLVAAAVTAATVPAAAGAVLFLLGWGARSERRVTSRLTSREPARVARRLVVLSVVLAMSLLAFAGIRFLAAHFGSPLTPALGAALALPALAVAGCAASGFGSAVMSRFWETLPVRLRNGRTFELGIATLLVASWGYLLVVASEDFLFTLAPWPWLAAAGLALLSAGVCLVAQASERRWRVKTQSGRAITALVTLALVGWHALSPVPGAVHDALLERTLMAGAVLKHVDTRMTRAPPPGPQLSHEAGAGRSCDPEIPPPRERDVRRVVSDAPDIVMVTVDALRWDRTTFASPDGGHTPELFERGRSAAVFERAYTPASSTRQTFRALFTGLINGIPEAPPSTRWGLSLAEGQPTLASYLAAGGYETIAFVLNPNAFPAEHGALQGFTTVDDSVKRFHRTYHYSAERVVDRIIHHLARPPDADQPVFVWAHLLEPHRPYIAGPEGRHKHLRREQRQRKTIEYVDRQLARLLDFTRTEHRRDRTVVVVSADHGEAFREHGNSAHGATVYEEEVHVPLLVWGPEVEPARYSEPVSLVDLLPTLLDTAGLSVPRGLCGQSLAPALQQGRIESPRPVYVAAVPDATRDHFKLAWIDGDDKLIIDGHSGAAELYDLGADPGEQQALQEKKPTRATAMRKALEGFLRKRGLDPKAYGVVRDTE